MNMRHAEDVLKAWQERIPSVNFFIGSETSRARQVIGNFENEVVRVKTNDENGDPVWCAAIYTYFFELEDSDDGPWRWVFTHGCDKFGQKLSTHQFVANLEVGDVYEVNVLSPGEPLSVSLIYPVMWTCEHCKRHTEVGSSRCKWCRRAQLNV